MATIRFQSSTDLLAKRIGTLTACVIVFMAWFMIGRPDQAMTSDEHYRASKERQKQVQNEADYTNLYIRWCENGAKGLAPDPTPYGLPRGHVPRVIRESEAYFPMLKANREPH